MPVVIAVHPREPEAAALSEAARVLRRGGLVAFPTETVYGLGALAFDESALARIFQAKGRPPHHPLIAHVEGAASARSLAATWPPAASRLADACWPGPLTLVVDRARHVPLALCGGSSSIALRVPSHPVALSLLSMVGQPIAAPSANRYQGLSPTTAAHVIKELGDRVDLVLDGGSCSEGIESTVIDVRADPPRVLRLGAMDLRSLREVAPRLVASLDAAPAPANGERASPGMEARHYASRAPMVIAASLAEAAATARSLAGRRDKRDGRGVSHGRNGLVGLVGLVVREEPNLADATNLDDMERVIVRVLPAQPSEFARRIYATLHELDDANPTAIVVQAVPTASEAWWAVADRLARGSTPV